MISPLESVNRNRNAVSVDVVEEVWLSKLMVVLDVVVLLSPSMIMAVSVSVHNELHLQTVIPEVVRF